MEILYTITLYIGCFSAVMYLSLVLYLAVGWLRTGELYKVKKKPSTQVSLIIPARNESTTIAECLQAVSQQTYPEELLQVLVVDDQSQDDTMAVIKSFIEHKGSNFHLLQVGEQEMAVGKKAAINKGIEHATGELIITTDADCSFGTEWIASIVALYEQKRPKMIIGPVSFHRATAFFGRLQSLEFMSLIGSTAGAVGNHSPIMANGANLAYEKPAFHDVGGFENIDLSASGDDVLLLHKFKKKYPKQIAFLKSRAATVYTQPRSTLRSFFNQRKRWVSKNHLYRDFATILTGSIVYFFNLMILLTMIMAIVNPGFFVVCMLMFSAKCLIDFLFLFLVTSFFGKRKLLLLLLPEQLLYVFYVNFIVLSSLGSKYQWKGRAVR